MAASVQIEGRVCVVSSPLPPLTVRLKGNLKAVRRPLASAQIDCLLWANFVFDECQLSGIKLDNLKIRLAPMLRCANIFIAFQFHRSFLMYIMPSR